MKVYGLPSDQGLDRRNDMALACGSGHIIPAVQAMALGQSINRHSALSLIYYCLIKNFLSQESPISQTTEPAFLKSFPNMTKISSITPLDIMWFAELY